MHEPCPAVPKSGSHVVASTACSGAPSKEQGPPSRTGQGTACRLLTVCFSTTCGCRNWHLEQRWELGENDSLLPETSNHRMEADWGSCTSYPKRQQGAGHVASVRSEEVFLNLTVSSTSECLLLTPQCCSF